MENEKLKDIKDKFSKSNKYMLYLDYDDIKILFNYIDELESKIDFSGNHIPEID